MARLSEQNVSRVKERAKYTQPERKRYHRTSNSDTPIPARASAFPRAAVVVRRRYSPTTEELQEEDVTCISTVPPSVVYQHESPAYEVESSVAYLSLVASEYSPVLPYSPSIDELDTFDELEIPHLLAERWQGELPIVNIAQHIEQQADCDQHFPVDISEVATNPPPALFQPKPPLALYDEQSAASPAALYDEQYVTPSAIDDVAEIDTVETNVLIAKPLLTTMDDEHIAHEVREVPATKMADLENDFAYKPAFVQHPLDFVRWWLLSPGRLEFLFWLIGGVLLGVVMCALLLVTGLSTGFMSMGHVAH